MAGTVGLLGLVLLTADDARATFSGFESQMAAAKPESFGRRTTSPAVEAYPIHSGEEISIDGRLDDEIWANAAPAGGFSMWDPDRGVPPSEETVFKVAYDDDAIYFGIACHSSDPGEISSNLSRRDRENQSDYVSIYVDPYLDKTTGYNFRVNPSGVQLDAFVAQDGNDVDRDWNAVWDAETHRDESGWYAEFRIPLSSIRYRKENDTWGLQMYRYMQRKGEDTSWATWERETPGFVSRFGTINNLNDIPAPRQLEVLPYAVTRATDPAANGEEEKTDFQNFGADLKYGITSDMTLNATINPDFGQVEADPATLNLSPFETFYQEKRPFFIEGSRFFSHRDFNLFYSRRIGTGSQTSRIRGAGKLTGKTSGDVSVGLLMASTDIAKEGKMHNLFQVGDELSHYFVGRVGKEWNGGANNVNLMQTASVQTGSRDIYGDRGSREAYTSGADFNLQFQDRKFSLTGSVVGSIIDPEGLEADPSFDPSRKYGTGGDFGFFKNGGKLRAGTWYRWESDKLDLNDMGFLSSPDEMSSGFWTGYRYNPEGENDFINIANLNYNLNLSWLYAGRSGYDINTGETAWTYSGGTQQRMSTNVNGSTQLKNYWNAWAGVEYYPEGIQRYDTRDSYLSPTRDKGGEVVSYSRESVPGGGPLIKEPTTVGGWYGFSTDSRKKFQFEYDGSYFWDTAHNYSLYNEVDFVWVQSSAINHSLSFGLNKRIDDTQHLENFENANGEGIGGVSFVYGEIDQQTADVTLRTNLLFNRNQSLELYLQPFVTVGDYTNGKELARADSYEFRQYTQDGFRAEDNDFTYASVNLNMVYRWEYRPGSTLYLVWTQARSDYEERGFSGNGASFDNSIKPGTAFNTEAENIFMIKVSYWLPI